MMTRWSLAAVLRFLPLLMSMADAAAEEDTFHMQTVNAADLNAIQEKYVPLEHVCDGFDEQWDNCADLPKCGPCTPRDCVFGEWSQWQLQGGCTGLQLRRREVQVSSNKCGQPCKGPLTETAEYILPECKAHGKDCRFGAWQPWTKCRNEKDQSMRSRQIEQQPEEGGAECLGALQETRPCGGPDDTHCKLGSWHEWTACSVSCGEGRHTRMRYVDQEAHNGGLPCSADLLETAPCIATNCGHGDCVFGEWSEWTACDEMFTQRFRHREVIKEPYGGGKICNAPLKETLGCPHPPKKDCELTEWQSWTSCTATCNGGQKTRVRNLKSGAAQGGTCPHVQLKETGGCGTRSCSPEGPKDCAFTEWQEWSKCSASCGEGSHKRIRKIAHFASPGAKPCDGSLVNVQICKTHNCQVRDCRWSDWEQWSVCSVSCDGGTKRRSRAIAVSPQGGVGCTPEAKAEVAPCNTQQCGEGCVNGVWGEWREWTPCSGTCNEAYRYRRRSIAQHPNYCGNATVGIREEFQQCSSLPECRRDQDCALSEWASWSPCSCHCFGMRHRSRYISTFPSGAGLSCFNESLKEIEPCNPGPDENTPRDCTNTEQQDCKMKEWQEWSQCSTSCGGGQQSRIREVMQHSMGGGKPCEDSLLETKGCNTHHCEANRCQDCRWGPWSQWGNCPKCGGQRYRHRNIEVMPNICGRRCEKHEAKQVSDCPVQESCHAKMVCAWGKWTDQQCEGKCGHASSIISRSLGLHKSIPEGGEMLFEVSGGEKCAGTQMNQSECPTNYQCQNCIPIPCLFGPWADWQEPTCVGLCSRSRIIKDVNNECGTPCNGPLTETKRCKADCMQPRDCQTSAWSEWGQCSDPGQTNGQKYRHREIELTPQHGGKPCLGELEQTIGCHQTAPEPCKFTPWGEWGGCSVSCGKGWHHRSRTIDEHAHRGGTACDGSLRELQKCNRTHGCGETDDEIPCDMGDWGEWSTCNQNHMQFRDKKIVTHAQSGGEPCAGDINQGRSCGFEPIDCRMSEWTRWGECDRTCGIGQARRQRQISLFPKNGGMECPNSLMETKGCSQKPCPLEDTQVSEWSDWGDCSKTCGPGIQTRNRNIIKDRSEGGRGLEGLLGEARSCHDTPDCPKQDCVWDLWAQWSDCSCTCGGGSRQRQRKIRSWPQGGGERCQAGARLDVEGCNTQPCKGSKCVDGKWGDWSPWTQCSASCDGGTTKRHRKLVLMANECGCPPPGKDEQTAFCNVEKSCEPSKDCRLSHWTSWTPCSATCNGIKRRTRTVEQYGRGNGIWCQGGLRQIYPCNPSPGEEPTEKCAGGTPQDCEESDWTQWSMCSKTCGGGEHMRTREILKPPKFGGKPCSGSIAELSECSRNACGGPKAQDCQFGEWETWSSCDKCNGERKRLRKIIAYPKYGGQECSPRDTAQVGKCPRRCAGQKFCEWAQWGEWSECTVTCGLGGKRRRRRYLELTDQARDELPAYVTNVMRSYEQLRLSAEELGSQQYAEMLAAFAAGLASLLAVSAVVRAVARSRNFGYDALDLQHA